MALGAVHALDCLYHGATGMSRAPALAGVQLALCMTAVL